ncbi:UROL1 protein, partial [Semnornis frantzii]|nr:UROL1 protein [Semnornis frantzii]
EKGLSLLGYHLCNYSLTKNVFKTVAYQKAYEKSTSCGGWIPWMVCPRTYYKTQYHTVEVPETVVFTDCCEGYEQVGLYCSLALNRSSVFASRPGICPVENMETSDYPCTFDTECPGLKKCCNSSKGAGCVDPVPEGRTFWYNVTVLVKMDFNQLIRVDSHFLNHSRLLHSMITGALLPLNASVHHIQSNPAEVYAGTVTSQLLIGLHQPAALVEVSSSLKNIVKRVYEVIDTEVQDVNECSYAEFNACPKKNTCVNLEGYYSCAPQRAHIDVMQHQLSQRKEGKKYPSAVRNHRVISVTSNSFEMSWHVTSTLNHTFQIQVFKGKEIVQNLKTEEMKMEVSQLEAGVMYSVEISYETCGKPSISHQNVKTEAKIFGVTLRILNYNFTEDFHNASSSAYEEFSRLLLTEVMLNWYLITVQDHEIPVDASTFAPVLSYLHNDSTLLVDQQNSAVGDWDECASHAENDCSVFAECINLMGSYLCRCKTTMDTNPSRPGRNCEGEIVDPLTETMSPEITKSTAIAPEEVSSAGHASPATTEMVAAAGSEMSAAVHLPVTLPLDDKQVSHSHSPTSAPAASWKEGLTPGMGFGSASGPRTTGVTTSKEQATSSEQQETVSPSQQSSVADASPSASHPASAVTNTLMGTAGTADQEQLNTPSLVCQSQTATANTRSHTPFDVPQANFQGGPSTALPPTGDAGIPALNATLTAHKTKTQYRSLTVSELEPSVLYIVEIRTDVCREGSKFGCHTLFCIIKLSFSYFADVQKLRGTVRITNVKFSPGFSNTSSEEYQTFAQLFVDEVHKSLPLEVLQQMDAGVIKVMIMGITNGSTVVSFNLVIAADMDIYYIITTFHDAFEHSSYFTVDKSSLSINGKEQLVSQ